MSRGARRNASFGSLRFPADHVGGTIPRTYTDCYRWDRWKASSADTTEANGRSVPICTDKIVTTRATDASKFLMFQTLSARAPRDIPRTSRSPQPSIPMRTAGSLSRKLDRTEATGHFSNAASAGDGSTGGQPFLLGSRWQTGQKNVERCDCTIRWILPRLHCRHRSPARP